MKKIMLFLLAMLTTTLGFAQTTTTWDDADVNIASGANVFTNAVWGGVKTNITDGNLTTTCQIKATGTNFDTEWIVIDLGYDYDITKLSLTTSGDRYDTGFAIYGVAAQPTAPTFADGTDALDGSWGDAIVSVDQTGQTEAAEFTRTYAVSKRVRYLKYVGVTRNATDQWGLTMNEFRVKGTTKDPAVTAVASIGVTLPALKVGNSGTAVVTKYNSSGNAIGTCSSDEVTLSSSNTGVATVNGLNITGVAIGTAGITATYTANTSFTASGNVNVTRNWDADDALSGKTLTAYASSTREGAVSSVVGTTGNWSSNDPTTDTEQWWFVDLGRSYNVSSVAFLWSNSFPSTYEIYTATGLKSGTEVSNDNVDWSATGVSTSNSTADATVETALNAENVRYIKIHGTSLTGTAATYGMRFLRFYLLGTVANASMTVGEPADGVVTCTGDWVESTFNNIDATKIDISAVSGVPATFTAKAKNPNAIIYAASTVSGTNVYTGTTAPANVDITDGYDFAPKSWFNVTGTVTYHIAITADHYSIVYFPFTVSSVPSNITLYQISAVSPNSVTISPVTSGFAIEHPYIIKSSTTGTYAITGSATNIGSSADGHNGTDGGVTIVSTLTSTTVPTGSYMFNASNQLAPVSSTGNVTLHPFAGYITTGLNITEGAKVNVYIEGETTGINGISNVESTSSNKIYNIAGQRVSNSYKGMVISNGKKYYNR